MPTQTPRNPAWGPVQTHKPIDLDDYDVIADDSDLVVGPLSARVPASSAGVARPAKQLGSSSFKGGSILSGVTRSTKQAPVPPLRSVPPLAPWPPPVNSSCRGTSQIYAGVTPVIASASSSHPESVDLRGFICSRDTAHSTESLHSTRSDTGAGSTTSTPTVCSASALGSLEDECAIVDRLDSILARIQGDILGGSDGDGSGGTTAAAAIVQLRPNSHVLRRLLNGPNLAPPPEPPTPKGPGPKVKLTRNMLLFGRGPAGTGGGNGGAGSSAASDIASVTVDSGSTADEGQAHAVVLVAVQPRASTNGGAKQVRRGDQAPVAAGAAAVAAQAAAVHVVDSSLSSDGRRELAVDAAAMPLLQLPPQPPAWSSRQPRGAAPSSSGQAAATMLMPAEQEDRRGWQSGSGSTSASARTSSSGNSGWSRGIFSRQSSATLVVKLSAEAAAGCAGLGQQPPSAGGQPKRGMLEKVQSASTATYQQRRSNQGQGAGRDGFRSVQEQQGQGGGDDGAGGNGGGAGATEAEDVGSSRPVGGLLKRSARSWSR